MGGFVDDVVFLDDSFVPGYFSDDTRFTGFVHGIGCGAQVHDPFWNSMVVGRTGAAPEQGVGTHVPTDGFKPTVGVIEAAVSEDAFIGLHAAPLELVAADAEIAIFEHDGLTPIVRSGHGCGRTIVDVRVVGIVDFSFDVDGGATTVQAEEAAARAFGQDQTVDGYIVFGC